MKFGSDEYYESEEWEQLRIVLRVSDAILLGLFQIGDGKLMVEHGNRQEWELAICNCFVNNGRIGKYERENILYILEHTN